ncbi:hypothetical protein FQR65_LT15929 [Abscondita terminalis]|nr:hypothetical protein FQR65_LT15929 [Abscondita terminalis]
MVISKSGNTGTQCVRVAYGDRQPDCTARRAPFLKTAKWGQHPARLALIKRCTMRYYGADYQRLDGPSLIKWIQQYASERQLRIAEKQYAREVQYKSGSETGRTQNGDSLQSFLKKATGASIIYNEIKALPAAIGGYQHKHTRRWAELIDSFDGFIFVTPEYNHAMPAALKNAIDYLFTEWNNKAAAFVSYGLTGGVRASEQLRLTLAEVKVACVRSQVALMLFGDFTITDMTQPGIFTPAEHHLSVLDRMIGELLDWTGALAGLRTPPPLHPTTSELTNSR